MSDQPELLVSQKQETISQDFSGIVSKWQDMVYNTALSIVQHEQDAEDITQDVFVKVYEQFKNFRADAAFSTWIYRITINTALDAEKKKKRAKNGGLMKRLFNVSENEEPVHFNHPGVLMDKKEQAAMLFKALKKLPEKQRLVFTLKKLEGLSNAEIADIMRSSKEAVESLMVRGMINLRKLLTSYYEKI
ncbi:MAG: RNA polymerase sigma factor [Ferruginibacter sp.]